MFRTNLLKTTLLMTACVGAVAGPLDRSRIADGAKWIVHMDVDALRKSSLGSYVVRDLVEPMVDGADALKDANLSINITNIASITAYGPTIDKNAEGVLIISTTADVQKDLDSVAGMFLLNAGTNSPFVMVEKDPLPLYTLSKSVYFAPAKGSLLVAKSRDQIERAHRVIQGKEDSLAQGKGFQDFREPANSFLAVAVADGFAGDTGMPAQAQILKEASGGRLCLGEKDNNLFLNLVFQGRDEMATTRIQQVLQGIMALVSLSQQDKDLTQLASAAQISSEARNVTVNLQYPVEKTIEKLREQKEAKQHPEQRPAKAKNKSKNKNKNKASKPEPSADPSEPAPAKENAEAK